MALLQIAFITLRTLLGVAGVLNGTDGSGVILNAPAEPEFDFFTLGMGLAGISFGLSAVMIIGAPIFGEIGEKALRSWIPNTIRGLVLLGVSGFILGLIGGG